MAKRYGGIYVRTLPVAAFFPLRGRYSNIVKDFDYYQSVWFYWPGPCAKPHYSCFVFTWQGIYLLYILSVCMRCLFSCNYFIYIQTVFFIHPENRQFTWIVGWGDGEGQFFNIYGLSSLAEAHNIQDPDECFVLRWNNGLQGYNSSNRNYTLKILHRTIFNDGTYPLEISLSIEVCISGFLP